jgi:hypothetical protein
MLTLNTILKHEGIEPKSVRLVRHQDARAATNCTPYDLWRAGDGRLETYRWCAVQPLAVATRAVI